MSFTICVERIWNASMHVKQVVSGKGRIILVWCSMLVCRCDMMGQLASPPTQAGQELRPIWIFTQQPPVADTRREKGFDITTRCSKHQWLLQFPLQINFFHLLGGKSIPPKGLSRLSTDWVGI